MNPFRTIFWTLAYIFGSILFLALAVPVIWFLIVGLKSYGPRIWQEVLPHLPSILYYLQPVVEYHQERPVNIFALLILWVVGMSPELKHRVFWLFDRYTLLVASGVVLAMAILVSENSFYVNIWLFPKVQDFEFKVRVIGFVAGLYFCFGLLRLVPSEYWTTLRARLCTVARDALAWFRFCKNKLTLSLIACWRILRRR